MTNPRARQNDSHPPVVGAYIERPGLVPDDACLMSAADVAKVASVSLRSVRAWIASGDLPSVRIGRCVRVRLSDWKRFLETRCSM